MMAMASTGRPPPPRPCTARAASSSGIDCASPQAMDPIVNRPIAKSSTRLRP